MALDTTEAAGQERPSFTIDKVPPPYWRAALAETSLLSPELDRESRPIQFSETEAGWRVTSADPNVAAWCRAQFAASKVRAEGGDTNTIPYVLIPARLSSYSRSGIKEQAADIHCGPAVLCIPCLLNREGLLFPDPDREPWIPRDLLEPTLSPVAIGRLDDYDAFVGSLPPKPTTFRQVLEYGRDVFRAVTKSKLSSLPEHEASEAPATEFAVDGYHVTTDWYGFAYEPPVIARHLIKLYDEIDATKAKLPLFDRLRTIPKNEARAPADLVESGRWQAATLGHINPKYPLSPSQREAMTELERLQAGEVLAVNGPPGTGKTTLLQSVVAQLWVTAALRQSECPLIVVTSTNVTAVENVLSSFAKIVAETGHERWHKYARGFGIFFAAESRKTRYPTCTTTSHPFLEYENPAEVRKAEEWFLKKATEHFRSVQASVEDAVKSLHGGLVERAQSLRALLKLRYDLYQRCGGHASEGAATGVARRTDEFRRDIACLQSEIAAIDEQIASCAEKKRAATSARDGTLGSIASAERAWNEYLAHSPLWLDLLSFLPPIRSRRNARDRAYLISVPWVAECQDRRDGVTQKFAAHRQRTTDDAAAVLRRLEAQETALNVRRVELGQRIAATATARANLEKLFVEWQQALTGNHADLVDVSLAHVNDELDLRFRAPMFVLADRYWTGKWLLEMKQRIRANEVDSKGRARLEAKYRRFAKLSPCIVSNFHIAPNFFTAWQGEAKPMWNTIDLLIVDEAGQVAPDVGAALFALAKRALVVGDTYQIEPVWNNGEQTDRANAVKARLVPHVHDECYTELAEAGFTPATGNLMRIANRSCLVQKFPEMRGLMLTEHRRCVPEIIAYCNELIYGGRLEPKRAPIDAEKRVLPPFGWVVVESEDEKAGTSRRNRTEAVAIAAWLKANRRAIETHYAGEDGRPTPLRQLVGVVTPFKAQARAIESELGKQMPDLAGEENKVTVGTVHALQGAERAIVIFSATYGRSHTGGTRFDQKPNMLNVAVSRAKDTFVAFGNGHLFKTQARNRPSGLLACYLFGTRNEPL